MLDRTLSASVVVMMLLAACEGPISTTDPNDDNQDTDVEEGVPNVVIRISEIDFGSVYYGESYSEQATVENTGDGELEITTVSATSPFSTSYSSTVVVAAGASVALTVRYQPTEYDDHEGTLTIETNDPDESTTAIALYGSVITDEDSDGYDGEDAGGEDCDDTDAEVNPGAEEQYYDGVDQNCDGADDYDQDGDGYQHLDHNDDVDEGGGDCNDANDAIYPGAEDTWYDGVDSDCDGADDWDADGDGEDTTTGNHGEDCDDSDPEINTSADETLDGVDNDCDGTVDLDAVATASTYTFYGSASSERAGWSVSAGDLDDDGDSELIVGAPYYGTGGASTSKGGVFFFEGGEFPSDGSDMEDANYYVDGDGASDYLGYSVAVPGDYEGDGFVEVAIGAPGTDSSAGAVYLVNGWEIMDAGYSGHTLEPEDALVTVSGDSSDNLGRGVSDAIDLDGDGLADLVGMFDDGSNGIFVHYGDYPAAGSIGLSMVDARFTTGESDDQQYRNMPMGADFDGDGYQDLVFCSGNADYESTNDGAVWMLWGDGTRYATSSLDDIENHATVVGYGNQFDYYGYLCSPQEDMTGDGVADIWIYGEEDNTLYFHPGGEDLREGAVLGPYDAALEYEMNIATPEAEVVVPVGDWNGDGISDIGYTTGSNSILVGELWMFPSDVSSGHYDDEGMFASVEADSDEGNLYFGDALNRNLADFDGDGNTDIAAGDYGWADPSGSDDEVGAVFVYLNVAADD